MKLSLLAGFITTGTLIIAGMIFAAPAEGASAASTPAGTSQATAITITPAQVSAAASAAAEIKKYDSTLTTTDGVVHFNAAAAIALGGSPTSVEQVAVGVTAAGGVVTGIAVPAAQVVAVESVTAATAHCFGATNLTHQWFGWQMKLNSCITAKVIAAGAAATVVAGIITAALGVTVVGGIIALVVGGLIGLGAAALQWCSSDSDGAIIDFGPAAVWCTNQ